MERFVGSLTAAGNMDPQEHLGGARLVWADFPTGCQISRDFSQVPLWNSFSDVLVDAAFVVAAEYLLDNGVFVTMCRGEHFVEVLRTSMSHDFVLLRVLYVSLPFQYILLQGDYGIDTVRIHWISLLMVF